MIFDFVRSVAAFAVLWGHASAIFSSGRATPPQWPQQLGVGVFFVLSGFLISMTLHKRLDDPSSTFVDYAIDRFSRIYSAFLPAILCVAAIDWLVTSMYPAGEVAQRYTVGHFFANLFMLQAPTFALPFGSAGPFWTIAIEFWIYIFVGLIAYSVRDGLNPYKVVAIAAAGIIPVQSFSDNYQLLWAWLLGAGSERVISAGMLKRVPHYVLGIAIIMLSGLVVWHIARKQPAYSLTIYTIISLNLTAAVEFSSRFRTPFDNITAAVAAWFAGWSYSLYLLHHSILWLMATGLGGAVSPNWAMAMSIFAAISFSSITERYHRVFARWLKNRWQNRDISRFVNDNRSFHITLPAIRSLAILLSRRRV